MQKSTILTNFCNPEITGLGRHQYQDSGLVKTAGIPRFRIPGLQYLEYISKMKPRFVTSTQMSR